MEFGIEIAAGSVVGNDHSRTGRNNQDAYLVHQSSMLTICLVSDGCGSSAHSEVGSKLLVEVAARSLTERFTASSGLSAATRLAQSQLDITKALKTISFRFFSNPVQALGNYFLGTLLAGIITPTEVLVAAIGDGVYALNGDVHEISFAHNRPPYPAYQLLSELHALSECPDLDFKLLKQIPRSEFRSLLIGTDGVIDLIAKEHDYLPGRSEPLGPLAQFWENDRYFKNPYTVSRVLRLANQEVQRPDWNSRRMLRSPGLLRDDTTLIAVRVPNGEQVM